MQQTSPMKHPRSYIVHGDTHILLVHRNILTSNTTEKQTKNHPIH